MNFKIGDYKEAIMATILLLALLVGVLYATNNAKAETLDFSITKALTCINSEYCMNYKNIRDTAELYNGEFEYKYVGRENLTVLGAADFYHLNAEGNSYLFRVDSRTNKVIQYFRVDNKEYEKKLMKKYGLDY